MADRFFKSKEEGDNQIGFILDDRSAWYPIYSQCGMCEHFESWDYFCAAYPNGIPDELLFDKYLHDKILPDQVGVTIFQKRCFKKT